MDWKVPSYFFSMSISLTVQMVAHKLLNYRVGQAKKSDPLEDLFNKLLVVYYLLNGIKTICILCHIVNGHTRNWPRIRDTGIGIGSGLKVNELGVGPKWWPLDSKSELPRNWVTWIRLKSCKMHLNNLSVYCIYNTSGRWMLDIHNIHCPYRY